MSKLSKIKKLTKVALLVEAEDALDEAGKEHHREWAKSWLLKREDPKIWSQLYIEVEESDTAKFCNVFRMMPELFNELLDKVKPRIEKEDTRMRLAIPAKLRLMITIRFAMCLESMMHSLLYTK